jgi:hypothetical protein
VFRVIESIRDNKNNNNIVNIRILNGATHRDGAVLSQPAPLCSTQQIQGLMSLCMKRHCGQISLKFPAPGSACSASRDLEIALNSNHSNVTALEN